MIRDVLPGRDDEDAVPRSYTGKSALEIAKFIFSDDISEHPSRFRHKFTD